VCCGKREYSLKNVASSDRNRNQHNYENFVFFRNLREARRDAGAAGAVKELKVMQTYKKNN